MAGAAIEEKVFTVNKKQHNFLTALFDEIGNIAANLYREFALWGGYGSGKTAVILLAIHLICRRYANVRITVIRETYAQLDDTIIDDFKRMFEGVGYEHKKEPKEMHYPNGSIIKFRAFDRPDKILGGNIDIIVVSQAEQIPRNLFKELFGRKRGKTTLPKSLLFTEGNPSDGWAKDRYYTNTPEPHVFYQHFTTYDNIKFLTKHNPNYISDLTKEMSESEIKRALEGDWESHDEMVFTTFKPSINIIPAFMPSVHWRRANGGDYGQVNPAGFVYGCVNFDNQIIIYDEFYERGQSYDDIAIAGKRHGIVPTIYDYSTKIEYEKGRSTWSELEKRGLLLLPSNKDELRNIAAVKALFKTQRLFITENCVNLIKEIRGYRWKRLKITDNKSPKEETVDKDNHLIDSLLYLCSYLEDLKSKDPSLPKPERMIKYHAIKNDKKDYLNYA